MNCPCHTWARNICEERLSLKRLLYIEVGFDFGIDCSCRTIHVCTGHCWSTKQDMFNVVDCKNTSIIVHVMDYYLQNTAIATILKIHCQSFVANKCIRPCVTYPWSHVEFRQASKRKSRMFEKYTKERTIKTPVRIREVIMLLKCCYLGSIKFDLWYWGDQIFSLTVSFYCT